MLKFFIIVQIFSMIYAADNVISTSFRPKNLKEFEGVVTENNNVLCTINYKDDEVNVFDLHQNCTGPWLTKMSHQHFHLAVGIKSVHPESKYYIQVGDGKTLNMLPSAHDIPSHASHAPGVHHSVTYHSGSSGSTAHKVNSPFGEPKFVFNFLSRKNAPLKGRELELKRRHVLKSQHLAVFDWELITNPGCQFVGPHVNATCTGCVAPAVPFDGPASRHHLCVLNNDDMGRWHREDFLAVYEVRREQFIDAYARYEDQIEHYNRIKAIYQTAKKAFENVTDTELQEYSAVVAAYKQKAEDVYETTKKEYELLHQLEFAMSTAKELYKASCQAFIDGLYDKGVAAPVFAHKHLEGTFRWHALKRSKPVLQGIHEILKSGGWKGKTFMLMRTLDNQIRHLLK